MNDVDIQFKLSSYFPLEIGARKTGIVEAHLKAHGDGLAIEQLSPGHKNLKSFKPGIWSWSIKPASSGNHSVYISIEAKRLDGSAVSSVVPINFTADLNLIDLLKDFFERNWQWIVVTFVIPFFIFLWKSIKQNTTSDQRINSTNGGKSKRRR